jgi:hypothetical protein
LVMIADKGLIETTRCIGYAYWTNKNISSSRLQKTSPFGQQLASEYSHSYCYYSPE